MLLLAARLNQELAITQSQSVQPMINMLLAMRQEEKEAADSARGSSVEIASETAHQTALEMANFIDQRVPRVEPPKSVNEMFAKRIDRLWEYMEHAMLGRLAPGLQQGQVPEGWEVSTVSRPATTRPGQAPTGGVPEGWSEQDEEANQKGRQ